MALFEFELTPAEAVTPWGPPNAAELHWYALTDGWFSINADGKLPLGEGVSSYIAQIWESLLEVHRGESATLNLRFLEDAPEVTFTRTADTDRMAWPGDFWELPAERLRAEIRDFHERLFAAMARRASFGEPLFEADQALRYLWLE